MIHALGHLVHDFLSTILFIVVFTLTDDLYAATGAAIACSVLQFGYARWRGRTLDPMQWMALGLSIAFGAAAMLTRDPRFVMAKPSLIHFAIGAVMLRRGWMARYLPAIVTTTLPASTVVLAGYAWAGLMFALGIVNLGLAVGGNMALWVWFVSVGAIGAKVVAFLVQYAAIRTMVRSRRRAAAPAP
jgi:intracellular septation protein A